MRFSKRIYALRDAVKNNETVADIGTDHGYVPMLVVRDGISPYAIMSDISADSLSKAIDTFKAVNIPTTEEQFRVGDGLESISAGEVDDVIIAGLGGHTIANILDADIEKSRSFKKLILQPRKHSGALRVWLYTHGFKITDEILTSEGKFICEIIVAVPTDEIAKDAPYDEEDIRWAYPETLKKADYKYLSKRVNWKLSSIEEQIENLRNSEKNHEEIISDLRDDYYYLEQLLIIDEKA